MVPISELDTFLADKLRFYRKQMKWPLKRLADELGVSLQQVQRYEQGTNKISASLLYHLADIFSTDVNSFFEGFRKEKRKDEKRSDLNVLLVEDNAHDEFLFRKALSECPKKIDLYVVKDGQEALNFFHDKPSSTFSPDIVFMDLYLPHIQGFELLQDLKRRPVWKDIPVIVMTTSTSEEDVARSYHLQSSGFIRKSFQFDEFKDSLLQTIHYWSDIVKLPSKTPS